MRTFCRNLYHSCSRKKNFQSVVGETTLVRCLSTLDLTLVGIGSTLGSGIYVLTGEVARNKTGPAIVISFLFAAIASILSGLCYAEFAARIPKAGSAYVYSYLAIGELCAFIIAWNLLLEYIIGSAAIARAVSAYIDSLSHGFIQNKTITLIGELNQPGLSHYIDILAFSLVLLFSIILSLGMKHSARLNNFCVIINLLTIVAVIIVGFMYVDVRNWDNFAPFGVKGIVAGSASCFFAFVGFDVIATTSEEAKNPAKSIPFSMIGTITICFLAYFGVSTVVTMMVPYTELDLNAAVAVVFQQRKVKVIGTFIAAGATAGLLGCTLVSLLPPPRLLYALAQDGLICSIFATVNEKTGVPVIGTLSCGIFVALLSAILDLSSLVEMLSIGTLLAYTIVVICVLILRYRPGESNCKETRSVKIIHERLDADTVEIVKEKEIKEEEISVPSEKKRTCFDDGFNYSNKTLVINMTVLLLVFELAVIAFIIGEDYVEFRKENTMTLIALTIMIALVVGKGIFLSLKDTRANTQSLSFKVPFVPWIPIVALFSNISLMLQLSRLTWYRFAVWLLIGLIFYFAYGIRHSEESASGKNNDGGYVLLQTMKTSNENEEKSPQVCPTRTD